MTVETHLEYAESVAKAVRIADCARRCNLKVTIHAGYSHRWIVRIVGHWLLFEMFETATYAEGIEL
jgi:hypothetical protein